MNNLIKDEQLLKTCKLGQGVECCKYICCSGMGFTCEKHTLFGRLIDKKTDMIAKGDNCGGLKDE
jgi:hypothetical protein